MTSDSKTAISVSHVSKKYFLGKQKEASFRSTLQNSFKFKDAQRDEFFALNDVSFDVNKGEVIGIIGKNGAGKSTILKILSQITKPTDGRIEINGRVASLLEVGTGFHPELTGRENIYLNGTILGMSRREVKEKFEEIVEFSGVQKFIDTPVKHYSSGMYVRLAFAVAAHLEPEILIIDEVLAVGDAEFQKKCLGKMKEVAGHGRTVLFVSHNMAAVKSLCDRVILLKEGKLVFDGETNYGIGNYLETNVRKGEFSHDGDPNEAPGNQSIRLLKTSIHARKSDLITMSSGIDIRVVFHNFMTETNIDLTLEVVTDDDMIVFHNGEIITNSKNSMRGTYDIIFSLPDQLLNAGKYSINLIFGENQRTLIYKFEHIASFEVLRDSVGSNSQKLPGIVFPKLESSVKFVPKSYE